LAGLGFANVCAANIFFPLLPALQESLDLRAIHLGAWMSIPALVALGMGPLSGRLADAYGRRLVIVIGLVIFVIGSLIPFSIPYVPSAKPYDWILVGRVLQNLGHVITFPLYLAVAGEALAERDRQRAMGTIESWASLGGIAGPLIGSFLLPLGLYVPFAAMASIVFIALLVSLNSRHVLTRQQQPADPHERPGVNLGLLTDGWHAYLGGLLLMGFMVSVQTFIGSFARDELSASRLTQGLMTGLIPAFMALGAFTLSLQRAGVNVGHRIAIASVGSVLAGMLAWTVAGDLVVTVLALALIGFGCGLWLPLVDHDISETSTQTTRGTRLAILHFTKSLGIFVAPALVGGLIDKLEGYSLAFGLFLLVGGSLSVVSVLGRWRAVRAVAA
jgi:ACDE family multidrug resistance protein